MPTYDYACGECGIVFERFQHFSEEPVKVCCECGGPVRRVIHPVGVIFKGSGWYVTDNRGNPSSLTPSPGKGEERESGQTKATEEGKGSPPTEPKTKAEPAKKD